MFIRNIAVALLACGLAVGCATTDPVTGQRDVNRTATGAILGAIAGAGVGALAGGDDRRNAIIGAGVGALAGAAAGGYMDQQERILRERMAGTGVGVTREGDEILLNMPADITFDFDSATVKPQFAGTLGNVGQTLAQYPSTYVDIVGHADSIGTDQYNLALSQRRANAVANYLTGQGVQSVRIIATGAGESQPIASNDTDEGRARNRRVEIRLRPVTA